MVVLYHLATEKAVNGIERNNSLTFAVEVKASKPEIKAEVEKLYGEKVGKVTTVHSMKGVKKAFVRFERKGAAQDIAAKLKIL